MPGHAYVSCRTAGSDEGVATGPGEAVLLQLQVDREAYHRAQLIDTMLNQLQNSSDLNEQVLHWISHHLSVCVCVCDAEFSSSN